ncbi:alpha/beta hydrolase family protein [Streptomyces yaizuensis]|uniref:Platelet-activating factor acetylhydrolase plasma/isoform II n=1 Tax=Streptomyces yaizuensis TaxID=2989713 RepID=A0ABQ5NSU3_9ACTN|nr:alpha/beta hydrolase [Streptomyces sp. YSPA8]GLF93081.1 Platelet-activating factor acetylhydrolase plasma/isoform II [Streptomyces sp. YSPA8]
MITFRRGAMAALLALSVTLPLAQTATAAAPPAVSAPSSVPAAFSGAEAERSGRVALPRPTGPYAVGTSGLHLTDTARQDPWEPGAGARQLLVSLHYPARKHTGTGRAPYLSAAEARELVRVLGPDMVPPGSGDLIAATRTWARKDARPAPGTFPLVVLSPGFGASRQSLTQLAEALASQGYVVASVDHAFESRATAFPGRGVLPCTACDKTDSGQIGFDAVARGRAEDVSFVLDRLTGPGAVWQHAGMIDPRRIGMAGHSIGGASAARAMETDPRVGAGVNMDGSFFSPVPREGLGGRPFLMLGAGDTGPGGDGSWDEAWRNLDGWKRWLTVTGTRHHTFSDAPVLVDQVPGAPARPGELPGKRSARIMGTFVTAFFDRHLKGADRPVLDGPTAADPEVVFHTP